MRDSVTGKEEIREKLRRDMLDWEIKHGKVETTPIIKRLCTKEKFTTITEKNQNRANSARINRKKGRVLRAGKLHEQGFDIEDIMKDIGVSKYTARGYIKEYRKLYGNQKDSS